MSMSDDILIRLRLDEGNVAAGFGRLRSEAGKLESELASMADIGAVSGQVKAIGGAIAAGVDQIEGRYNRLAQKLKDIQAKKDGLSKGTTTEENAKYESALKALKEAEGRVMSSMASVGKQMNKALDDIVKLGMKDIRVSTPAAGGVGALNREQIKNYEGGGMEAAIAALKAAYKDEEAAIRARAAQDKKDAAEAKKARNELKAALKEQAAKEEAFNKMLDADQASKLKAQSAMIAARERAEKLQAAQDRKDEKQALRDAKQAMTPRVAADQIIAENKAVADALRAQEKFIRDHNNKVQGLDAYIERAKKDHADAEANAARIAKEVGDKRAKADAILAAGMAQKASYDKAIADREARNAANFERRQGMASSDSYLTTLEAKPFADAAKRAAMMKENAARLMASAAPGKAGDPARMAAQIEMARQEKLEADALAKHNAIVLAHHARVQALNEKQNRAQEKLGNLYKERNESQAKMNREIDAEAGNLGYLSVRAKQAADQTKKLGDKISEAWMKSEEAKKGFADIAAANQRAVENAKRLAAEGADQRKILMSPSNVNRAEKLVMAPEVEAKLAAKKAFADSLSDAALDRQIAAMKAKIALYDKSIVDATKQNSKSQQPIPIGLTDSQMKKLQMSQLLDLQAQLKLQHGTARQANERLAGSATPPVPPNFNPINPKVGPLVKTMAANVGEAMAGMAAKLRAGAGYAEKLGNSFTEAGGKLTHFVDKAAFGLWKVQGAVRLVTGVWEQFMEILSKGETILKLEYAFESMTKGAGASMEKFREATKNMVSDEAIQKLANFGVQQKMTGKELEMIMERASGAALVTGRTTEEITRRFVEGISKQEREIMDEATVIMSNASVIWNKEAKRLGKKSSDLTQQEKQKAYMRDFVQQSEHLERVAANFPDKLGKISKAQTSMTNAWNTLWGQVAKTFGESGALDQMGTFIAKVTGKLATISGNEQAITWAKQFGDLMTEMARTSLGAATALSPLAAIIPLITNALANLNGPLLTAVNLWSRYQTIKLHGLGAVGGALGMGFGAVSGDQDAIDSGMSMFLDAGKGIANAAGYRSPDEKATDIKYTQKARDAMARLEANPADAKAEFQTSASNAKEYTKALSYLYSEEKRIIDLRAQNKTKPILSDTGTNYQNALDATRQGVVGMAKSGNIVDVAGAAFDIASNRSKSRGAIDAAKVELKNMDEWLQYRKAAAEKAREAKEAFDPRVMVSVGGGADMETTMSKYEEAKKLSEENQYAPKVSFRGVVDENAAQYTALLSDFMEKERAFQEINIKAESLKGIISSSTSELEAATDAQDKFLDSFKAFNEEDARMMSGDLYEKTMVTIPGRLRDRMNIKDWIGSRSTLRAGAVDEYGPENRIGKAKISQEEIKSLSDELTMDPARKKDAAGLDQYKQEAVKTNLEAFRRMEVELLDAQFKLQNEKKAMAETFEAKSRDIAINYAMEMMNSYLMSGDPESLAKAEQIRLAMTEASMQSASTLMAALPQGHADGISLAISEAQATGEQLMSVQEDRLNAELEQSRAMIAELEKRLKTRGGGRKKEKKFINSEIMDLAESFGSEAAGSSAAQAFNMNRDSLGSTYGKGKFAMETERLAAGYMGRLSNETAEAFERGIKIEVDDEVKERIKRIVDENQQLQKDIMVKAMQSGSQEEFKKAQDRIGALQAALEKTDLLQHYEDSSGIQKAISTRNEQLQSEAELWERNSEFTKLAKDSAERANQADFDYRKGMAERMAASREYAMAMTGPSSQFGAYGMTMEEVDPEDIPDYMRVQAQDPLSAMKKEEWDRKREAIKKERDQRLQELHELHKGRGELGAVDMGGLWSQQKLINQEAESQLGMVQLEQDADGVAQARALSQRYYEEVKKPWENMGLDLTEMFAESIAFGMNDMWVAALNDAEDWTESMMALFENMTGAIGEMLQVTATAAVTAYTGSPMLGKVSGGLIKGTWDAIMNLFKKKEKKEDDQNRRAERELRRKETKKADSFTVVLVNNGLSVNRDTARQVGAAVNAYVNGGGKLKNSR